MEVELKLDKFRVKEIPVWDYLRYPLYTKLLIEKGYIENESKKIQNKNKNIGITKKLKFYFKSHLGVGKNHIVIFESIRLLFLVI